MSTTCRYPLDTMSFSPTVSGVLQTPPGFLNKRHTEGEAGFEHITRLDTMTSF